MVAEKILQDEQDDYAFSAAAGQRLYVDRTAASNPSGLNWRLADGYGRVIASNSLFDDLGPVSLVGGSNQLSVFGEGPQTGTYTFRLVGVLDGGPAPIRSETPSPAASTCPARSMCTRSMPPRASASSSIAARHRISAG